MHREKHRVSMANTNHFILYGGPSCGKGYSGSTIIRDEIRDEKTHPIVTGDMIRTRFEKDATFKNEWGEKVSEGYFVKDHILNPMVQARYTRGKVDGKTLFVWDGYHRTPIQVKTFDSKFFCEGDRVTVAYIKASKKTCKDRNEHRNRITNRSDGGSFSKRWSLYEEHTPGVLKVFYECNIEVVEIDGDADLDAIASNVWAHWCRFTGVDKPMPEIQRRQVPAEKHVENPGASRVPFSMLVAA